MKTHDEYGELGYTILIHKEEEVNMENLSGFGGGDAPITKCQCKYNVNGGLGDCICKMNANGGGGSCGCSSWFSDNANLQ
jgi:hypothetical protein